MHTGILTYLPQFHARSSESAILATDIAKERLLWICDMQGMHRYVISH